MTNDTKPQLDKSFSLTRGEQAAEYGAAPPDDKKKTDKNTPRCRGCRSYHGPVNEKLNCLAHALDRKDQEIKTLREEIASLTLRLRLERGENVPSKPVEPKPVEPEPEKA